MVTGQANIGQAIVNLKLWLSKSSSSHRQLHGGRGFNAQSLPCESHTLPLGYHPTHQIHTSSHFSTIGRSELTITEQFSRKKVFLM